MTRIKICGVKAAQDMHVIATLPCSYVGFVFARASRRAITFEQAKTLRSVLLRACAKQYRKAPATVGVFVNEAVDVVAHCLNSGVCDICQLHGTEDENYIARLRKLSDKPCIQAFRITSAADVAKAQQSEADYVLLDAGAGDGKSFNWKLAQAMRRPYILAGGLNSQNVTEAFRITSAADVAKAQQSEADYVLLDAGAGDGKSFNWKLAQAMRRPYILAGGLNSQNVTEAITLLHPFAVDVSSGVEEQGHKSELKMNAFCTAVVNADKASKKEVQHG